MLNSKKTIPSLSGMISSNLVDKITSMLFDDINNADDGTMIVYFVAEFMKSFYKPYCESLDSDDITKRNFYFDFCNNELLNFLVDYDDSEYISVEFKKGAIILSDYYTNTELLNNALKIQLRLSVKNTETKNQKMNGMSVFIVDMQQPSELFFSI